MQPVDRGKHPLLWIQLFRGVGPQPDRARDDSDSAARCRWARTDRDETTREANRADATEQDRGGQTGHHKTTVNYRSSSSTTTVTTTF